MAHGAHASSATVDRDPVQSRGAPDSEADAARPAGLLETARAVLWSFFGVRGRAAHERDLSRLNPLYVILMGILLAVAFVVGLISLVRFVVS